MHRNDQTSGAVALPAYPAPGATDDRFYTDPVGPTPGTVLAAWHANMLTEEICNLVENAGLTLSKADDTQLTQAAGGAAAIKSHATDTGSVTNLHTHGVIGCITSQAVGAAGETSAVIGATSGIASGDGAVVVGGATGTASGASAVTVGGSANTASAIRAVAISGAGVYAAGQDGILVASRNVEMIDTYTLAGGYDAGGAIAPGGVANQNLTWRVANNGGNAQFGGSVYAGGDCDHATIGNSATCRMDGATGEVTANGGLRMTDGTNEACETYVWTNAATIAAGAWQTITVANTSAATGSCILWNISTPGAASLIQGGITSIIDATSFAINVKNDLGVAETQDITVHYTIINPK